ncbi:MAG TPA: hypothetical protein VIJ82_26710 [Streptosporangiaceae bacterium]
MDDTTAGPRVTTLQTEIGQLRARHHEITDTPGDEPAPPQAPALARLGTYLRGLLDAGTPAMRKAVIETLIAEIRITEGESFPVFRIPASDTPLPGDVATGADTCAARFAQWCVRWGGWGSNPRPADYESAPPPSTPDRDRPDLAT